MKKTIRTALVLLLALGTMFGIVYSAATKSANDGMKDVIATDPNFFLETYDAWTMCVATLAFTGYDESKSPLWNTVIAPQLIGMGTERPCEILTSFTTDKNFTHNYTHYSRYWHGSGAVFILLSSTYGLAAFSNLYFFIVIFSFLFFATMWTDKSIRSQPIFFLLPLVIGSNFLLFERNYAHTLPIVVSMIFGGILARVSEFNKKLTVLIAGMFASFFDLLTSPFLFMSIVLFAYVTPYLKNGPIKLIKCFSIGFFLWFTGFFGNWLLKWALAENFGQKGEISKAINQSLFRLNGDVANNGDPSIFAPINKNIAAYVQQPFVTWTTNLSLALLIFAILTLLFKRNFKFFFSITAYLVLTTILLVGWYALFRNHSLIHSWFTFKSISVIPAICIAGFYYYLSNSIWQRQE